MPETWIRVSWPDDPDMLEFEDVVVESFTSDYVKLVGQKRKEKRQRDDKLFGSGIFPNRIQAAQWLVDRVRGHIREAENKAAALKEHLDVAIKHLAAAKQLESKS